MVWNGLFYENTSSVKIYVKYQRQNSDDVTKTNKSKVTQQNKPVCVNSN